MVSGPLILRRGTVDDPLALVLSFVEKYVRADDRQDSRAMSFDERDLRAANRGGARISAIEIAAILDRRGQIERALHAIPPTASLVAPAGSVPWSALTRLFDAFADIRGVGFSKMTKALHRKRPALIPILDSVVQAYLADDPGPGAPLPFGARATALVRSYKEDLDRNGGVLGEVRQELASRGYALSEVRMLDIVIWSVSAG
jgi:Family of unknown function (DUF6308)